jgi:hypothetical protein
MTSVAVVLVIDLAELPPPYLPPSLPYTFPTPLNLATSNTTYFQSNS